MFLDTIGVGHVWRVYGRTVRNVVVGKSAGKAEDHGIKRNIWQVSVDAEKCGRRSSGGCKGRRRGNPTRSEISPVESPSWNSDAIKTEKLFDVGVMTAVIFSD